jgi:serine O-acetyltransferase
MIQTKEELKYYLKADETALRMPQMTFKWYLKELIFPNYIWRFERLLRKCEYYKNKQLFLFYVIHYFIFRRLSVRLGFSIPLNVFGPGLAIVHYGTIVVSANAKIGANCRIHPSTCIGAAGGLSTAPQIGDNVYIGPGVKIYGEISIGNNIAIAPNAAVCNSFLDDNQLIGGVPAKQIKDFDISTVIKHLRK